MSDDRRVRRRTGIVKADVVPKDPDHPGYIMIDDIFLADLGSKDTDPYVKVKIEGAPAYKGKDKTKAIDNRTDAHFEDQLFFEVQDSTPKMLKVKFTVKWEKFLRIDPVVGTCEAVINPYNGGKQSDIELKNENGDYAGTLGFSWQPAMLQSGGFLSRTISPEILKGVKVPLSTFEKLRALLKLNFAEVHPVLKFVASANGVLKNLEGLRKIDPNGGNSLQPMIDFALPFLLNGGQKKNFDAKKAMFPVEGYKHFGTQDNWAEALSELCKCNPFFTSALTYKDGQFHLIAYEEGIDKSTANLYLNIANTMLGEDEETQGNSRKINVSFDGNMKVSKVEYFDKPTNGMKEATTEKARDFYCSGALYNLLFYTECIHATIHILHYIMIMGVVDASDEAEPTNKGLITWAKQYEPSIAVKYFEVGLLLINNNDNAAITGKDGIGGSWKTREFLHEILETMLSCNTKELYLSKFIMKGLQTCDDGTLQQAGILTEVMKHFNNVGSFANDLVKAFKGIDANAQTTVQDCSVKLYKFLQDCMEGQSDYIAIQTLEDWINLMSLTGITHGCTLSLSRLGIMPGVMRWRDINTQKWDDKDLALVNTATATTVGAVEDHHVFTHEMLHSIVGARLSRTAGEYDFRKVQQTPMKVMEHYDKLAERIKLEYEEELVKDMERFKNLGWILTDHCTDGFDGKQHSIATYF